MGIICPLASRCAACFHYLDFAEPLVTQSGKHIKGLVPGSPAALAGLREGDELAETVTTGLTHGSFHPRLTLTVRRGCPLPTSRKVGKPRLGSGWPRPPSPR